MSERPIPNPTLFRLSLVALGLVQATNGIYALLDPRGFYSDFPLGRGWVEAIPGYNPHLVTDVGALFLATGVLMLLAAAWLGRRLVTAALVTWLVFAIPHLAYHMANLGPYDTGDVIGNVVGLVTSVVLPVALVALLARTPRPAAPVRPAGTARIPLVERPRGVVARAGFRSSKRLTGAVMDPVRAFAHHPTLLAGYGALEMAAERSDRVEERLKDLAVMRAAMLTGCEWCLDFGSATVAGSGIDEEDLKALAHYGDSPRFSELERLVLDYAGAVTRTPVDVDDALVARLREHLDDGQMVELTTLIALENLRSRFNWALGIGSQGFSDGGYCVRPAPLATTDAI